jgi:uncharacterized protein (DUF885 family)
MSADPQTSFVPMAERVVDELLAADPGLASEVGEHHFDHQLPDLSDDAVAVRTALLRDAAGALSGVDTDDLDEAERVDHEQLLWLVERTLFGLTEIREREWNPLVHNPGPLLHALVARPFAPVEERAASVAGRLTAIPDALATARTVLGDCPRVHLETGAAQFRGTATFVREEVRALLEAGGANPDSAEPIVSGAAKSLDEFAGWLADRAAALGEDGGRDPRLGRRLYEAKLWHTLDTELTAADVLRLARETLDRVTEQIREAAAELVGGRGDDDTVRSALSRLAGTHPSNDTIVGLAARTLEETTEFVREHGLVSLVDDDCVIREMPEFDRGVAVAYCDSPGPLETSAVPTFYCIAPTPVDWGGERVESFYREYNDHMIRNLTVHEAMPGHFLQLAHARRYRGSTRVRAVVSSGPFIEGWAVYAEQVMVDNGFGGLPVKLQQLKMQLRMTINAILDQLVHCEDFTEGEAMALMTGAGFQEEGEAAGKWRRALLTSTQLSTYFVGYSEVAAIAAARPAGTPVGAWHDAMLSHGSPSPRHLRRLLRVGE